MTISTQAKALAAAESLAEWSRRRVASGNFEAYVRAGKLNRSKVAKELGFPRSSFQSNRRLGALADQLDREWGAKAGPTTVAGLAMREYIRSKVDKNEKLPIQSGALSLREIIAQAGIQEAEFANNPDVRKQLKEYADAVGVNVSLPGSTAPEEESRGRTTADPAEMVPLKKLREAQTRVSQLEKQVADLRSANAAMRANNLRQTAIDELIAAGRRIVAPKDVK